jgi:cell division protein ZapA
MPELTVEVAGKSYRLGCGEGEERHLLALAARVDGEAARLGTSLGTVSEGRLMLMSALMLADRLSETEAALQAAERRAATAEREAENRAGQTELFGSEREAALAGSLESLASRVEALVDRIEGGA